MSADGGNRSPMPGEAPDIKAALTDPRLPDVKAAGGLPASVRAGLVFAFIAYFLWGMMPLYLRAISHVPPLEIVAHRVVWSILFGAALIWARGQMGEVKAAFRHSGTLRALAHAAIFISLNWLIYVWAVMEARILESSLGYFINPLMYVAAGVFVLKEKLRPIQTIAVGIASLGVLVLTVGLGTLPWVALVLAALFTGYGYIRKTVPVGAMPGLFVETVLLGPFALAYLAFLAVSGTMVFTHLDWQTDVLLLLAGPVTVMPLLLFALSARRLTMVTVGLTQYLGPTLQFGFALYFGETFTIYHAVCFGLIWTALAIFSVDAWKHRPR
ncbi:MAG: EamA family transporter RarD [Pseudomonadota bacterium]